jgi:hypothetical protein
MRHFTREIFIDNEQICMCVDLRQPATKTSATKSPSVSK